MEKRRVLGVKKALKLVHDPNCDPASKKCRMSVLTHSLADQEGMCCNEHVWFLAKKAPIVKGDRERLEFRHSEFLSTRCSTLPVRMPPVEDLRPLLCAEDKAKCLDRPNSQTDELLAGDNSELQTPIKAARLEAASECKAKQDNPKKDVAESKDKATPGTTVSDLEPMHWRQRHQVVFKELGWQFNAKYFIIMHGGAYHFGSCGIASWVILSIIDITVKLTCDCHRIPTGMVFSCPDAPLHSEAVFRRSTSSQAQRTSLHFCLGAFALTQFLKCLGFMV